MFKPESAPVLTQITAKFGLKGWCRVLHQHYETFEEDEQACMAVEDREAVQHHLS